MELDYVIRYARFKGIRIHNNRAPDQNRIDKLNQNYHGWVAKLERSILKHGIRNAVLLYAKKDGLDVRYGGCRLMFAQKHFLDVDFIIADYDNIFPEYEEIPCNIWTLEKYFKDDPIIRINKERLNIGGLKDFHVENY